MNITITLDAEQTAALDGMVAQSNAADGGSLTPETYLAGKCLGLINNVVQQNYEAAVRRIGDLAKDLPYESRVALVANLEAQLS